MFRRITCLALLCACHPAPSTNAGVGALPGVISGVVENAYTGEAIPGAVLHVREHGETVESDQAGRFVLTSIPPGTHRVIVQAAGFLSGARENVVVEADGETAITIRVFPANPTPHQEQEWLRRRDNLDEPTTETETTSEAAAPDEVGSITQALGGPELPQTIRVWRSQGTALAPSRANGFADRSCEGDVL
ncbi:MAG: carboxypeptidase-like regulatory domain-containing protein, partial [Polyangiales bacterium]